MASGDTRTQDYLNIAANGTRADLPTETCCETRTQTLIRGVAERVIDVEEEVEELKNNPDVVDIVGTYQALQNYDTSTLTDKDVIRVLADETHNGDSTYYRYSKSLDSFTYIGESKQYSEFIGTDGQTAGTAGLVPAPATTDVDKFLKSDGTWAEAGGGSSVNVVQITGQSTTDVMSQDATTSMVFADPGTDRKICIGASANTPYDGGVAVGAQANVSGSGSSVAIGGTATASGTNSIAIGGATASFNGSVAIGRGAAPTRVGEFHIGATGSTSYGYNNTAYRVLGGVHDPVDAHDAATKGYVDANAGGPTVVQTTGQSTTDVMSQDATTKMIYPDITNNPYKMLIGEGAVNNAKGTAINGQIATSSSNGLAIGLADANNARVGTNGRANSSIAIGNAASAGYGDNSIAIGASSYTNSGANHGDNTAVGRSAIINGHKDAVALGAYATVSRDGEVNVGAGTSGEGYNSTNYRVIGGVHDPVDAHDAATKGYVDGLVGNVAAALNIINNGEN